MFGYVNVLQDELKIKDYKVFKAYYCGLCKQQGKLCGNVTRLGLTYDFAVLAIILDSIAETGCEIAPGRCMLHPFQKRAVAGKCDALTYCAYMSVALSYYKMKDDVRDGGFSKAIPVMPFFGHASQKIEKIYFEKVEKIKKHLDNITELEKNGCKSIDLPAYEFGKLMAELFDKDNDNIVLNQLGYNIGRWIYIIDAIDDFEKDTKKGRYNPFETKEDIKNSLNSLWYNMSEIAAAYELLDMKRNKDIVDNVVYLGIKSKTNTIIERIDT